MPSKLQHYNANRRLAYWAEQIRQCRESGLPVAKWCEAHHISKSNYYRWQQVIFQTAAEQQKDKLVFAELPAAEDKILCAPKSEIVPVVRITGSRLCMEIYPGASPEIIASLCKVLENAP